MNNYKIKMIATVCSGVLLTGCATMGQSMGLGALGCAALGAGIGVATGSSGIGAGAGAGCMAIAAAGIYSYHSSQTRTAQQDQKLYGYAPVTSPVVKIRTATAVPEQIRAGDMVKLTLDYSVMAPNGIKNVDVIESMTLKHDGKLIKDFPVRPINRPIGGNSAEVDLPTPANSSPGTYVIEYKVQAGSSNDVRPVVFVVGS